MSLPKFKAYSMKGCFTYFVKWLSQKFQLISILSSKYNEKKEKIAKNTFFLWWGLRLYPPHNFLVYNTTVLGFPGCSVVKNLTSKAGDLGLIYELWRSPGERNGNPLQYSCLSISKDRGAWQAIVHKQSYMIEHAQALQC